MASSRPNGLMLIWLTFIFALILQAAPWPGVLESFRPSWTALVLIFKTFHAGYASMDFTAGKLDKFSFNPFCFQFLEYMPYKNCSVTVFSGTAIKRHNFHKNPYITAQVHCDIYNKAKQGTLPSDGRPRSNPLPLSETLNIVPSPSLNWEISLDDKPRTHSK